MTMSPTEVSRRTLILNIAGLSLMTTTSTMKEVETASALSKGALTLAARFPLEFNVCPAQIPQYLHSIPDLDAD